MMGYEWRDNCGDPGRVSARCGHGVRVMLWDCDGDVTVHVVPPAKAREIAAALLQAADAAEGVPEPVCEGRR